MIDFYEILSLVKKALSMKKFGNIENGNYTEFEEDGTLVSNGAATTYDDMLGDLIGKTLESPSAKIIQNITEGSLVFKTTATTADYVVINTQFTHRWKFGSAVHPHLHWTQEQNSMPNWLIQYRWQRNGQPKTTVWTSAKFTTNAFSYVSGSLNQITAFPEITPPANYSISDIMQIRLIRDTTNLSTLFTGADLYTGDVQATSFDTHVMTDTLGSRQEYVK